MMEEIALVLNRESPDQDSVWVRTQRKKACDGCQLRAGCGQQTMVRLMTREEGLEWQVPNLLQARPGDVVVLQVPESGVMGASFIVYILPLLVTLLGAMMGAWMAPEQEGWQVVSGLTGLALGVLIAAHMARNKEQHAQYQPVMARFAETRCQS